MENGEWKMEPQTRRAKGELGFTNDDLRLVSGTSCIMENGEWRMENGEWKMENGK